MELDKRIKDISTIQTILQHDVNCIGCKGYFFDEFVDTKDLSGCCYGELIDITTHDDRNDLCFKAEYKEVLVGFYRFFIPEDALNPVEPEKKYRPYTLAEWADKDIQDIRTTGRIMLINMGYLLQELFERYEICINGEWQPFGVLEE